MPLFGAARGNIQLLAVSALDSRPAAEALIGLQRIGIETRVLAPAGCRYAELVCAGGVELEVLPSLAGSGWRAAIAVRENLARRPADILYLDSISVPCAIVLGTLAADVKVVVRLSYLESAAPPSILARAVFKLSRIALVASDVSPERAGDSLTSRWLAKKLTILPTAHSVDWYRRDIDLQTVGIPAGAFTVASVSDQSGDAGLRWLISSAHGIPMDLPIHFLLIAPKSGHERLRRLIRKMPFTQRFHLSDELNDAPGLLASSSVAVITDWRSELQRRSCMQCLSLGVPILAADSADMRQIVQAEVNGELLAGTDPEILSHSIFELYENKERHSMLSAGAKRSARQWPSMQQQVMDIHTALEQLLAGSSRR